MIGQIAKNEVLNELKITPVTEKINVNNLNWTSYVDRMSRNRLARIIKIITPKTEEIQKDS